MKQLVTIILIVASILVIIWFKDGFILGVAEDGLIFYNLSNYFHQAQYTWMEYPGLGSPTLSLVAVKPTLFLFSYLQNAGIQGFLIQAGVIWLLLVSSGIGIYLLVRELFPNLPMRYVLLPVFFYWFNPISMADVWNRFLLNYIFFFALLPIGSYFYIKGLKNRRYLWIFILNTVLILYSYAFSYVAFVILFWIWLFLVTFYYAVFHKIRVFSLKYFFLALVIFSLVNSWWFLPLIILNVSGGFSPTANLFFSQNNTGLLDALSKSVGSLTGIFKLTNASFLSSDSLDWVKIYYSAPLSVLMFITMGILIHFLIKFRKNLHILFLGSLFLTIIFFAKGTNPPFGEVYNFIYKQIPFLQVFRNPFEKFGFLLSLTSTILLGPSLYELTKQIRGNYGRLIYPFFFVMIFFYLGFPLFSGLALTNKFPPTNNYSIGYKVRVPEYYKNVNDWLSGRGKNFRYIGLPIKDEGITYNWEKGYSGVELNVALFSNPGIIHNTSVPYFNQIVPEIEARLMSDKDFTSFANSLNVKYLLLRYDIDYKSRDMTPPEIIEKRLAEREQNGEVKKVTIFGKVSIWENLKWKDNTFYVDKIADDYLPQISYEKINTTKYILHVRNAVNPYLLVFSELYNDAWSAVFPDGGILNDHSRVNIFGNGWVVDRKGDYDIQIEFSPQKWMDIGEKISFAVYLTIAGCLIYLLVKRRRNKQ